MRDFIRSPAWALLLLVAGVVVACQTVPITGRSQLQILPESEEMRMGVQSYADILKTSRVSTDPVLNELVTRVGSRIAAATGRRDYQWEYKYMAKAGYDPHGARDLWVRMAEASKGQARPPEFLSTHPSEATRIRQIEAWMPEAMTDYRPAR